MLVCLWFPFNTCKKSCPKKKHQFVEALKKASQGILILTEFDAMRRALLKNLGLIRRKCAGKASGLPVWFAFQGMCQNRGAPENGALVLLGFPFKPI